MPAVSFKTRTRSPEFSQARQRDRLEGFDSSKTLQFFGIYPITTGGFGRNTVLGSGAETAFGCYTLPFF